MGWCFHLLATFCKKNVLPFLPLLMLSLQTGTSNLLYLRKKNISNRIQKDIICVWGYSGQDFVLEKRFSSLSLRLFLRPRSLVISEFHQDVHSYIYFSQSSTDNSCFICRISHNYLHCHLGKKQNALIFPVTLLLSSFKGCHTIF